MSDASKVSGVLRWFAVMLAIVALSPMPLALPSGIAVALIGLMGGALLLNESGRPGADCAHVVALRCKDDAVSTGRVSRPRSESGERV